MPWEIVEESLRVVVEDELVGETGLLQQGPDEFVIGDVEADVCVAAEDDGHIVKLAQAQNLEVVPDGLILVAPGIEAAVVDFQQGMRLFGSKDDGLEEELGSAVSRMGDNLGPWVPDGGHHAVGVLFDGPTLPTEDVDASNANVEHLEVELVEIEGTLGVKDIEFSTEHEPKAAELAWDDVQVAEIDGVTGARNARGMLCDAQDVEILLLCSGNHFLQRTVGVAAHDGVGVDVKL